MNMQKYRKLLMDIDLQLRSDDLESLKFLCAPYIRQRSASDMFSGCDLFQILESNQHISSSDLTLLHKLLSSIGRRDLCDLIAKKGHIQVDSALELEFCQSPHCFHQVLFETSEEMTLRDVSSLRYLYHTVPQNKKIKFGFDLFSTLIELRLLAPDNLDALIDNLEAISRKDLAHKLKNFREKYASQNSKDECLSQASSASLSSSDASSPNQTFPKGYSPYGNMTEKFEMLSVLNNGQDIQGLENVGIGHSGGASSSLGETGDEETVVVKCAVSSKERAQSKTSENLTVNMRPSGVKEPITETGNILARYKMDAKPRGVCLVVNNEQFTYNPRDADAKKLKCRAGSNKDTENIKECFEKLHFDVRIEKDLTDAQILETYKKYADDGETNKQCDCFMTFILSHGGTEKDLPFIYGSNGRKIYLKEITHLFRPSTCQSLWGKPKVFFLASCLGGSYSRAVPKSGGVMDTDSSTGTDSPSEDEVTSSFVCDDADFLIGYSTIAGNVSFRDTEQGTWYISAITDVFSQYHERESVHHMLVEVNRRVTQNKHHCRNENGEEGSYTQVPAPQHTLTKQLWF